MWLPFPSHFILGELYMDIIHVIPFSVKEMICGHKCFAYVSITKVVSWSRKQDDDRICTSLHWGMFWERDPCICYFCTLMAAEDGCKNCPCNADRLIGSSCSYLQWRRGKNLDKRCCVILTLWGMTSAAKVNAYVGPGDMALYFVITSW